jgi:hypothetical protein
MDRRCLRSPHDIRRDRLVRVAAEAADFEIAKPGVDRIASAAPPTTSGPPREADICCTSHLCQRRSSDKAGNFSG